LTRFLDANRAPLRLKTRWIAMPAKKSGHNLWPLFYRGR
jgi:hypothetical protein